MTKLYLKQIFVFVNLPDSVVFDLFRTHHIIVLASIECTDHCWND